MEYNKMTVGELIIKLQKHSKDHEVLIYLDDESMPCYIEEVVTEGDTVWISTKYILG